MSHHIPRLEMNELAPEVQNALAARVKRLGYLGEFFKCSGHNPDVLVPFMEMTEALKEALPDRLTEVGALTVAAPWATTMSAISMSACPRSSVLAAIGWRLSIVSTLPRSTASATTNAPCNSSRLRLLNVRVIA